MTIEDRYDVPFETEDDLPRSNAEASSTDGDIPRYDFGLEEAAGDHPDSVDNDPQLTELALPYVGRWKELISTTNWEKGRIISQWRSTLIESGAEPSQYSDEAWARRVGGVTAPHVGRLRRVYDRFADSYESYAGLYWSHFLAALDWDDAPLWLEGAVQEKWSVSQMREQRWQSLGAVDSARPTSSEIVEVDTDEDVVLPAQGGGRTKEYGDEPSTSAGPVHEEPDFGEEEELATLAGSAAAETSGDSASAPEANETGADDLPSQPFAGLPELPDDLSDAIESLKLAILRHKTSSWEEVDVATIQKYLDAMSILLRN